VRSTVRHIAGSEHARVLIFHERAAIKTMVSPKAYVELCSELWGKAGFPQTAYGCARNRVVT
jgi:hypothetical protein